MKIKIDNSLFHLRVYSDLFKEIDLSEENIIVEKGEDLLISPCPFSSAETLYSCFCGECQVIYPFLSLYNFEQTHIPDEISILMNSGEFACLSDDIQSLTPVDTKFFVVSKTGQHPKALKTNLDQNEMDIFYACSKYAVCSENLTDKNLDFILINRAYLNKIYSDNFVDLQIFNDIDLRDSTMDLSKFLSTLEKKRNYVLYRKEAS